MGDRIAVLNFGVLQQFDDPATLYDHPSNMFVAGFIGSPAMNFFNMSVTAEKGTAALKNEQLTIPVTGSQARILSSSNLSEVIVGLRPEHILDARSNGDTSGATTVPATVEVVETLGNEFFVYLNLGAEEPIVARLPSDLELEIGQQIDVVISPEVLHFFDPTTELTLHANGAS
jgi:multiple sugar transport system ATP-binding protein